ncbi:MAG: SDR family oxidoreductase [Hyphomicrobiaceae bacterium]|nr:SDR family oxidoreductase [Hyphomicrobiaceae bacterium]
MTHDNKSQPPKTSNNAAADRLSELHVGYSDSVTRTITAKDVETFANLSGDQNPLHMDDEFAARTKFSQRVVHGFLHASLLSTLVGMKIPGREALYLSQTIEFTSPVFIGDTVEARGTITHVDKVTRTITMDTQITTQNGDVVLRGVAKANVLRISDHKPAPAKGVTTSMSELLTGKTALVTGASRGIGRAIALTLADHGAAVWINYHRSEQAAKDVASEINARGGTAHIVKCDVTSKDDVAKMIETVGTDGALDILINNAGPKILSSSFNDLDWSDMQAAYDNIVGSTFNVMQAAMPALKDSKGKIVNVLTSAVLGRTAHNWLPYVSAKSALLGMSKNLAQELGPSGVTVNMVSPTMVETDLTSNVPDRIRQMMVSRTPLRRMATVDDVAKAVLFLASPYADFVTGDNLLVTGGDIML